MSSRARSMLRLECCNATTLLQRICHMIKRVTIENFADAAQIHALAGAFVSRGLELQCKPVHAITLARRRRSVIEHMPKMAAASATMDLGAHHAQASVCACRHGAPDRRVETWPSGSALKLRIGPEQGKIATRTDERTTALFVVERTATRRLGSFLAEHGITLRPQQGAPLRVAMGNFKANGGECRRRLSEAEHKGSPDKGPDAS